MLDFNFCETHVGDIVIGVKGKCKGELVYQRVVEEAEYYIKVEPIDKSDEQDITNIYTYYTEFINISKFNNLYIR